MPTRASRVCSVWGQAESEVSAVESTGGHWHVSTAIEGLTVVLPVRADFDEAELDDLTRRANWEKSVRATHVISATKADRRCPKSKEGEGVGEGGREAVRAETSLNLPIQP